MVSCILLFCVLYSIRYIFYDRQSKKAAIFSKNVHYTAFSNSATEGTEDAEKESNNQ